MALDIPRPLLKGKKALVAGQAFHVDGGVNIMA